MQYRDRLRRPEADLNPKIRVCLILSYTIFIRFATVRLYRLRLTFSHLPYMINRFHFASDASVQSRPYSE